MLDECHLLGGDLVGYVWAAAFGGKFPERVLGGIIPPKISHPETCLGKTEQRIVVPMTNERQRQTPKRSLELLQQRVSRTTLRQRKFAKHDCLFAVLAILFALNNVLQ